MIYLFFLMIYFFTNDFAISEQSNYDYEEGDEYQHFNYPESYKEMKFKREWPRYPSVANSFQHGKHNLNPRFNQEFPNSYVNVLNDGHFKKHKRQFLKNSFPGKKSKHLGSKKNYKIHTLNQSNAKNNMESKTENHTETDPALPRTESYIKPSENTNTTTNATKSVKSPGHHINASNARNVHLKRGLKTEKLGFSSLGNWFDKEMSDVESESLLKNFKRKKGKMQSKTKKEVKYPSFKRHEALHPFNSAAFRNKEKIRRTPFLNRYIQNADYSEKIPLFPRNFYKQEGLSNDGLKRNIEYDDSLDDDRVPNLSEKELREPSRRFDNSFEFNERSPKSLKNTQKAQRLFDKITDEDQQIRPVLREAPPANIAKGSKNLAITDASPMSEKSSTAKPDIIDKTNDVLSKEIAKSPNVEEKLERVVEDIKTKKTLLNDKRLQQETSVIENEKQKVRDKVRVKSEEKPNKTETTTGPQSSDDYPLHQDQQNQNSISLGQERYQPNTYNKNNLANQDQPNMQRPDSIGGNEFPKPMTGDNTPYSMGGDDSPDSMSGQEEDEYYENSLGNQNQPNMQGHDSMSGDNFPDSMSGYNRPDSMSGDIAPGSMGGQGDQPYEDDLEDQNQPNMQEPESMMGDNTPLADTNDLEMGERNSEKPIAFLNGEVVKITTGPPSGENESESEGSPGINENYEYTADLGNSSGPDVYLKEEKVEKESKTLLRNKVSFRNKTALVKGERKAEIKNNKESFHEVFLEEKGEDKYPTKAKVPGSKRNPGNNQLEETEPDENDPLGAGNPNSQSENQNLNQPSDDVLGEEPQNYPNSQQESMNQGNAENENSYEDYERGNGNDEGNAPVDGEYNNIEERDAEDYGEVDRGDNYLDEAVRRDNSRMEREPTHNLRNGQASGKQKPGSSMKSSTRESTESKAQQAAGNIVYIPLSTTTPQYNDFLHIREEKDIKAHRRHAEPS